MKKKVFVDFDDSLVDHSGKIVGAYNIITGKEVSFDELVSADVAKSLGISKERLCELYVDMERKSLWTPYETLPGAKSAINSLDEYSWNILTARRGEDLEDVVEAIQGEGLNIDDIYSTEAHDDGRAKSEILLKEGASYMVEDNLFYAKPCIESGVQTFLIKRPWNRDAEKLDNLILVESWNQIKKYLE